MNQSHTRNHWTEIPKPYKEKMTLNREKEYNKEYTIAVFNMGEAQCSSQDIRSESGNVRNKEMGFALLEILTSVKYIAGTKYILKIVYQNKFSFNMLEESIIELNCLPKLAQHFSTVKHVPMPNIET